MALKADKSNLAEYSKRVEQLSDHLKRSLVLEKVPLEKATEMVIDDVVELCRSNTNSLLVKSALISSKFRSAKEVIASYVIQSRKDVEERQILSFGQNNRGNFRQNKFGNSNKFQNREHGKGQNFSNRGQNSNFPSNNSNFRGNFRGKGQYNNNYGNRGNFQNGRGHYQNNRQNQINYAGNGNAPPSGAMPMQTICQAEISEIQ